jgi:hypothetical protein
VREAFLVRSVTIGMIRERMFSTRANSKRGKQGFVVKNATDPRYGRISGRLFINSVSIVTKRIREKERRQDPVFAENATLRNNVGSSF